MQPGRGVCVEGEEVEIERARCFIVDVLGGGDTPNAAIGVGFDVLGTFNGGGVLTAGEDLVLESLEWWTWV